MSDALIYGLIGIAVGSVGTSFALSLLMTVSGAELRFPEDRDVG